MPRTIKVNYLSRVEGEGALTLRFDGERAKSVELRIFEPPRFFEGFLRGRGASEVPDITARICGICPVSYQMTACHAFEKLAGIEVPESIRSLRRLLYAGEWIESHALHIFMLHLPDFMGHQDALALAREHPEWIKLGLAIKKIGNHIVEVLGGREIHPINIKLGGFYRLPESDTLGSLLGEIQQAQLALDQATEFLAELSFPEFERDYEFVALRHDHEYPFNEGRVVSNRGVDIEASQYENVFVEEQVKHSTALQAAIVGRGAYVCGPLARLNLNFDRLRPRALRVAQHLGFNVPCTNPFQGIWARAIETMQALDEAEEIVAGYSRPREPCVDVSLPAGRAYACTEAPRGLQYQGYEVAEDGSIVSAKIVPPTSQNQRSIEEDLFEMAPELARLSHADATWRAEQAIRNYDPCISCSTHFLKLKIEKS